MSKTLPSLFRAALYLNVMLAIVAAPPAAAQGLGGLLKKKVKEKIQRVNKGVGQAAEDVIGCAVDDAVCVARAQGDDNRMALVEEGTAPKAALDTVAVGAYTPIFDTIWVYDTIHITVYDTVEVTNPPIATRGLAQPFGLLSAQPDGLPPMLTLSSGYVTPSTLLAQIGAARARKRSILLVMTGGDRVRYMSAIKGVHQFDRAKWEAVQTAFDTPTIRTAIAEAVADGTVIGASVMDEPYGHATPASGGNTWGPEGTMTKARVDSLCRFVKQRFPTLPVGVVAQHQLFEPTEKYRTCDFFVDQYRESYGSVITWRDAGVAAAAAQGTAVLFSMNVLDGGTKDTDGTYDCAGTGGRGTFGNNCRMTPAQILTFGQALLPAGCGLLMWRADDRFTAVAGNLAAFADLARMAKATARKPCHRA